MSLRGTSNTTYVPDELWRLFRSGAVDHFEYAGTESAAIFTDGTRQAFDCTVTQAMLDEDRARQFAEYASDPRVTVLASVRIVVARPNFNPTIVGLTE